MTTVQGLEKPVKCGFTHTITIEAYDEHSNPQNPDLMDNFVAEISGPQTLSSNASKLRGMTYECNFQVTRAGKYTVNILLDGRKVAASPYNIIVDAGKCMLANYIKV